MKITSTKRTMIRLTATKMIMTKTTTTKTTRTKMTTTRKIRTKTTIKQTTQTTQTTKTKTFFFFYFFFFSSEIISEFFLSVGLLTVPMSSLCLHHCRNSFSEDKQILGPQDVPCSKHKTVFRINLTRKMKLTQLFFIFCLQVEVC